jgi:XRE family aerobic/anaerobic benzoate catabolism transcriptional regulator
MSETKVLLGKRIRSLRRLKDYSQEQLAEKAGISGKYVGEIERGQANISIDVLDNLSKALEISISSLLDFEHESERKELIKKLTASLKSADDNALRIIFRMVTSLLK